MLIYRDNPEKDWTRSLWIIIANNHGSYSEPGDCQDQIWQNNVHHKLLCCCYRVYIIEAIVEMDENTEKMEQSLTTMDVATTAKNTIDTSRNLRRRYLRG